MATSKEYAYYIKGNKIAIVQKDYTSSGGQTLSQPGLNDLGGVGALFWKSPKESITDGLEIQYVHTPSYTMTVTRNLGFLIMSSIFIGFGGIGFLLFSFFFSQHMQTMEGGMIACQNKDDADYIRSLRAHGWCRDLPDDNNIYKKTGDPFKDSFTFVTPGYSVRPLEMSGAIGSAQLKKCDKFIEQRRNNAEYFKEKFNDLSSVRIQKEIGQSSWFGFSIILEDKLEGKRDIVIKALTEIGVETRPIISGNFMKQPAMEYMNHIHRDNYDNADY